MSKIDVKILIPGSYTQNLFYAYSLNHLTFLGTESVAATQLVCRKTMHLNYFILLKYIEKFLEFLENVHNK